MLAYQRPELLVRLPLVRRDTKPHTIGNLPDDGEIVRDEQHGEAVFIFERLQKIQYLRLNRYIKCERLINDDKLWLGCQGSADCNPLSLTTRTR